MAVISAEFRLPVGQKLIPSAVNADDAALGDVMTVESDGSGGLRTALKTFTGSGSARTKTTITTAALATLAQEQGSFTISKGTVLIRARELLNHQCRVRIYGTAAARTADLARARSTSAVSGSATTGTGIAVDLVLSSAESYDINLDPKAVLASPDDPSVTTLYYTIQNLTAGTVAIVVELHHTPIEA